MTSAKLDHGDIHGLFDSGVGIRRLDGWESEITHLGKAAYDKRLSYRASNIHYLDSNELDSLFSRNDLARKIVSKLPDLELRGGWVLDEVDPEVDTALQDYLEDLQFNEKLREARMWERLHGGAVMILGVNDGNEMDKPLNPKAVREIRWIEVLDRWSAQIQKWTTTAADAEGFAKPEIFSVSDPNSQGRNTTLNNQTRIHASRCIWFPGMLTPPRVRNALGGWGLSAIEPVYDVLRDFGVSFEGAAILCSEIGIASYKMKGLADLLAAGEKGAIQTRLEAMALAQSIIRARVLDADMEEYVREGVPMTGLDKILSLLMHRISAAADMPQTVLFGRSPAGMNATGESDNEIWYSNVEASQKENVKPRIEQFLNLIAASQIREVSLPEKDWRVKFNPLKVQSDEDRAEVRNKQAQTDNIYLTQGVLSPEEVRESRFGGDEYSIETELDPNFDPAELDRQLENALNPATPDIQSDPEGDPDSDETL